MNQVQAVPQRQSKNRYRWWLSVLLILIVIVGYCLYLAEIILLRAGEPLALGASPVLPTTGINLVATLNVGDNAYVTECRDIKSDLVIQVRTKTGETGYVSGDDYILIRKNVGPYSFFSEFNLVTFSCRGLFENRSQPDKTSGEK